METQTNTVQSKQQQIHRRVQQKIAGQYLDHVDPDGVFVREFFPEKLAEFKQIDSDTKKKFDIQHRKYRKSESAYSIQNVCWLIASMAVFYYTDFYRAVLYDPRILRLWFNVGVVLVGVNICIALFLIVYLSFIKKVHSDEWESRYPAAIPVASAAFVVGGIFMTVGLWPVWGIFTPAILIVFLMGFVVLIAMMPNF
ncbi:TM128-like protein [Mya arenaria]|uniref:TM128-like protein n=1 Tax=Mya arenaria TaxID=6604 RepID=A0ABY7FJ28_MYAAR|nr:transmembrane protein 128-like [Mya arenaria]WAR22195.1 TM128-like protein [Mya arenaria]